MSMGPRLLQVAGSCKWQGSAPFRLDSLFLGFGLVLVPRPPGGRGYVQPASNNFPELQSGVLCAGSAVQARQAGLAKQAGQAKGL